MIEATAKCLVEHGPYLISQHPEHGGCPYVLLAKNYQIDLGTVACSWKDRTMCENPEHADAD